MFKDAPSVRYAKQSCMKNPSKFSLLSIFFIVSLSSFYAQCRSAL